MKTQRRLAARIFGCSPKKVRFDPASLEEIRKAITGTDVRGLIRQGIITLSAAPEQSAVRARKRRLQKRKGRRSGHGSRKGAKNARLSLKLQWMNKVRAQRRFIQLLRSRNLVAPSAYRMLYRKVKGGYFRNIRHLKLYLEEYKLLESPKGKATAKE